MFNLDFPSDTSSVKFRAVQWICTEVLLALAALLNFMPRAYRPIYREPALTPRFSSLLQACLPVLRRNCHA